MQADGHVNTYYIYKHSWISKDLVEVCLKSIPFQRFVFSKLFYSNVETGPLKIWRQLEFHRELAVYENCRWNYI